MAGIRPPGRYPVDGQLLTVTEIAQMLGISPKALYLRRSRLGGMSYQCIVNMFRSNQICSDRDRSFRYLIDGRWVSTNQIAAKLGVSPHSIHTWRSATGGTMADAIAWYRQLQTGERKRHPGIGGAPRKQFRVGKRTYTILGVAERFGVTHQSVCRYVRKHGMAAALKHYREREAARLFKAEKEILKILMGE